ncbi:MAG: DUF4956 domain-containing protein, partial [Clostridiales bacterium]|nr:DUF4956 domain-containing protein [Clostridiales bacterium]
MNSFGLLTNVSTAGTGQSGLGAFFAQQFRNMTPWSVGLALLIALVSGMIISFVYRKTYKGVLYSPSFSLTLIMLTLITTPVVMCIKSDIALSMGMVGALSIVRFRTAVKDPLDTAYMFWSITTGILMGTGLYLIGFIVVIGISIITFALTFIKLEDAGSYLLVLHYDEVSERDIENELMRSVKKHKMRSKTLTRSGVEM